MWVRAFKSCLFLANLTFIMWVDNFWLCKMSDCLLFLYIFWSFLKNILLMVNLSDWTVCSVPEHRFILRLGELRVVEGFVRLQDVPINLSGLMTRCDNFRITLGFSWGIDIFTASSLVAKQVPPYVEQRFNWNN